MGCAVPNDTAQPSPITRNSPQGDVGLGEALIRMNVLGARDEDETFE